MPTVINNPETLCSVSFILANGADEFKKIGSEAASGTKIVSLSGSVQRAGVVEVPMGTTLAADCLRHRRGNSWTAAT